MMGKIKGSVEDRSEKNRRTQLLEDAMRSIKPCK
jgi:hypothetical protein